MFGIGMPELIIILVIILMVFGAGKLPEVGKALGQGIKNFKKGIEGKDMVELNPKQEGESVKES